MWKFALYSSVKTSRQNQANHASQRPESSDHTQWPDDRTTGARPSKRTRRKKLLVHKPSNEVRDEEEDKSHDESLEVEEAESDVCCVQLCSSEKSRLTKEDSFLQKFDESHWKDLTNQSKQAKQCVLKQLKSGGFIVPSSLGQYQWLCIISVAVVYNMTVIIARQTFPQLQSEMFWTWLVLDSIYDAVYVTDMIFKAQTGHLSSDGIMIGERKKCLRKYLLSSEFFLDLFSILPFDLFYFVNHKSYPLTRLNRLFRWGTVTKFFNRTVQLTKHPTVFRLINLVIYIVIIIHWNACFYYAISSWIGIAADDWVYPGNASATFLNNTADIHDVRRKYLYSFYWSTLTLLTIGETPHPETDAEYVFTIVDFLLGVLIFATIVGNVGSMITNMNHERGVFNQKIDDVKRYMKIRSVGSATERRIKRWFDYIWSNQHFLDEEELLIDLPNNLRARIALHVHINTLRQVGIFKTCEPGFMMELVLKLRLQVFSPGDYICKRGDIGREMYIIKSGMLKVLTDDGTELATLSSGHVFGEMSIIEIPGYQTGNRRNANVMSVGYSDCFALSKNDLWSLLKDYPETREMMIDQSRRLLKVDESTSSSSFPSSTTLSSAVTNKLSPRANQNEPCQFMRPHTVADGYVGLADLRKMANLGCDGWIHKRDVTSAPAIPVKGRGDLDQRLDNLSKAMKVASESLDQISKQINAEMVEMFQTLEYLETRSLDAEDEIL